MAEGRLGLGAAWHPHVAGLLPAALGAAVQEPPDLRFRCWFGAPASLPRSRRSRRDPHGAAAAYGCFCWCSGCWASARRWSRWKPAAAWHGRVGSAKLSWETLRAHRRPVRPALRPAGGPLAAVLRPQQPLPHDLSAGVAAGAFLTLQYVAGRAGRCRPVRGGLGAFAILGFLGTARNCRQPVRLRGRRLPPLFAAARRPGGHPARRQLHLPAAGRRDDSAGHRSLDAVRPLPFDARMSGHAGWPARLPACFSFRPGAVDDAARPAPRRIITAASATTFRWPATSW